MKFAGLTAFWAFYWNLPELERPAARRRTTPQSTAAIRAGSSTVTWKSPSSNPKC